MVSRFSKISVDFYGNCDFPVLCQVNHSRKWTVWIPIQTCFTRELFEDLTWLFLQGRKNILDWVHDSAKWVQCIPVLVPNSSVLKELGQQAWEKWACLPSPQPQGASPQLKMRESRLLHKTNQQARLRTSSKDGGCLVPLFSFHFSPAPPPLTPGPAAESTKETQPSLPPAASRTIAATWVINRSTLCGNSFSYFPRCWVFGLWDHFNVIVAEELKARERIRLGPWRLPSRKCQCLCLLSPVKDHHFQSHLKAKQRA